MHHLLPAALLLAAGIQLAYAAEPVTTRINVEIAKAGGSSSYDLSTVGEQVAHMGINESQSFVESCRRDKTGKFVLTPGTLRVGTNISMTPILGQGPDTEVLLALDHSELVEIKTHKAKGGCAVQTHKTNVFKTTTKVVIPKDGKVTIPGTLGSEKLLFTVRAI